MVFRLACGDVMPGCSARFENADRSALMQEVATHAAAAHGLTDLTTDVIAAVESKVRIAA